MKKMFLVSCILFLTGFCSMAQTTNYNAYELTYKVKSNGTWNDWSEWEECDIDIIVKLNESIEIQSSIPQKYKVIDVLEQKSTQFTYKCQDKSGTTCEITFFSQDDHIQIMVQYSDKAWAYNMVPQ
jgi:hypothetical protein